MTESLHIHYRRLSNHEVQNLDLGPDHHGGNVYGVMVGTAMVYTTQSVAAARGVVEYLRSVQAR